MCWLFSIRNQLHRAGEALFRVLSRLVCASQEAERLALGVQPLLAVSEKQHPPADPDLSDPDQRSPELVYSRGACLVAPRPLRSWLQRFNMLFLSFLFFSFLPTPYNVAFGFLSPHSIPGFFVLCSLAGVTFLYFFRIRTRTRVGQAHYF